MKTHLLFWRSGWLFCLASLALSIFAACSEKPAQAKDAEANPTPPAKALPKAAKEVPKPSSNQAFADRPYKIRVVPGEAAEGKAAMSVIEITPTAGYKMNQDFPSRLRIDVNQSAVVSKNDLRGPDVKVSEEKLRFDVAFTPKKNGSLPMSGVADFSVCNENTCKLYRGERVVWDVAVR